MSITITEPRRTVDVMRRIELTQWGVDNLATTSVPRPEPGPGQVLVQMKAVALNFRDLLVISGVYNPKMPLPLIPVSDGAGHIVERGLGATKFELGALAMPIHVPDGRAGVPSTTRRPEVDHHR